MEYNVKLLDNSENALLEICDSVTQIRRMWSLTKSVIFLIIIRILVKFIIFSLAAQVKEPIIS